MDQTLDLFRQPPNVTQTSQIEENVGADMVLFCIGGNHRTWVIVA